MAPNPDLETLLCAHQGMVQRRVRRMVGRPDVDDLVQQVFERAVRHWDTFEGRSSPVTWLYQVATRVSLNYLRDTRARAALRDTWGPPAWTRPAAVADPETRTFLAEVWRQLDPELTEIGTYHYVDGLTQAEIAKVLGCSRQTVGNRLTTLRDHVRAVSDLERP